MEELKAQVTLLQEEVRHLRHMVELLLQRVNPRPMEVHKDILPDEQRSSPVLSSDRSNVALEWQIRRLTNQLTVAYNRIAALEDELMLRRQR